MRGSRRGAGIAAIAVALGIGIAPPASAVNVTGNRVTLEWERATGAVGVYLVWVSFNGGPFLARLGSAEPRVTIEGEVGDSLRVRVAAWGIESGRSSTGPLSEPSDLILFVDAPESSPPPPDVPTPPQPQPDPPTAPPPASTPFDGMTLDTVVTAAPWRLAGTGDFDGNGQPDVLRHNLETGQLQAWLLDGRVIVGGGDLGSADPGDRFHVGDYDGDGTSDVLVQSAVAAKPEIWLGSNAATRQVAVLPRTLLPHWRLTVGDFDGDGRDDLFLLDAQNGFTERLLLKGSAILAQEPLTVVSPHPDWQLLPGDFDGDGLDDVGSYVQGYQWVWLSNDSRPPSIQAMDVIKDEYRPSSGDLDGDGRTDWIYHKTATGAVGVWYMNGSHRIRAEVLTSIGSSQIVESLDLDADGKDDLLIHSANGPGMETWLTP